MRIIVFDTETIGLTKCYTYNVGYVIYDTETAEVLDKQDFIIEQVWHNLPLFQTAYYADKRPLYISAMKGKRAKMIKFGYAMRKISKAIHDFDVECGYAFNSPFDEKVFDFNCDWYKVANPLDEIPILDIRGVVHKSIAFTEGFQTFCDNYGYYTEGGNYSTTAETVYRYLFNNDFVEAHTALADSEIEMEILVKLITDYDLAFGKEYKTYNSIPKRGKSLTIIDKELQTEVYTREYTKIRIKKDSDGVTIHID